MSVTMDEIKEAGRRANLQVSRDCVDTEMKAVRDLAFKIGGAMLSREFWDVCEVCEALLVATHEYEALGARLKSLGYAVSAVLIFENQLRREVATAKAVSELKP